MTFRWSSFEADAAINVCLGCSGAFLDMVEQRHDLDSFLVVAILAQLLAAIEQPQHQQRAGDAIHWTLTHTAARDGRAVTGFRISVLVVDGGALKRVFLTTLARVFFIARRQTGEVHG